MPSRKELLEAIEAELRACERANPPTAATQFRRMLEHFVLLQHRAWVCDGLDDQRILQQISDSLEKSLYEVRHQGWIEVCCID